MDGWMDDGWMDDGWMMDGWMDDGWMDGWIPEIALWPGFVLLTDVLLISVILQVSALVTWCHYLYIVTESY